ncbi:hypothetical protein CR513_05277, partial [Mucuna pruriens]
MGVVFARVTDHGNSLPMYNLSRPERFPIRMITSSFRNTKLRIAVRVTLSLDKFGSTSRSRKLIMSREERERDFDLKLFVKSSGTFLGNKCEIG